MEYKEGNNFYRQYLIQEFVTWEDCNIKAAIIGAKGFTYGDLYKMICHNAKKMEVHGKVVALCNMNSISFIVDLITIMVTGNIPLIIPYDLHEEDIKKIKMEYTDLTYRNSDLGELLSICANNKEYEYEGIEIHNEIAVIMFSSGTTAMGKMIAISYKSLYFRIHYTQSYFERIETHAELFFAPLSSALGLQHQLFPCLFRKCMMIIYEGLLNPRKVVDLVHKYQISYLSLVPSVLKCIYQYCIKKEELLPTLEKIFICGEKTNINFLIDIWGYFKTAKLYQAYGMSEMLPISIQLYRKKKDIVENCVGKIIEEAMIKIENQDENGVGEICVAGANMINSYYGANEYFEWLKTGDLGYIDEKQFLYILGRKKNMVIVNGKNIYTEIIESIAEKYYGIEEARVIGIKDELRGESILLEVKLKDSVTMGIRNDELRNYIYQKLHISNLPIKIQVVDQIERTNNFKKKY